jgi:hypothetical protein
MIMASKQTAVKKAQPEVEQKVPEKQTVEQTQVETETPKRTGTKMEKATAIYLELVKEGDHKRADSIRRFMSECDLSKAASSTYFQVLKARHKEGKI